MAKKASALSPSRMSRSPERKLRTSPPPPTTSSWSSVTPSKAGAWRTRSWTVCIGLPGGRGDGRGLLGDVDRRRAPRDAATAPDATRRPELVDPGGELVGHPLAVARARRAADAAAVDVGVPEREARVPHADALGLVAGEVGHVLDVAAEARRAHHRAVAARQAAIGHVVPARMLEVVGEQVLDPARVERPRLARRRVLRRRRATGQARSARQPRGDVGEHRRALLAAGLGEEAVAAL